MSSTRLRESRLPQLLEEISAPRTPAYYDDILGQVTRTRQRPGWTFIERWLPMTTITGRLATVPRAPMRLALALVLLMLALVLGAVLLIGSQRPTLPAPFGVAGNGHIVFANGGGAIVLGNLDDGSSTVIIPGRGHSRPVFSPDGRWLAYLQRAEGGRTDIAVSGPSGEQPHILNTTGLGDISGVGHLGWTPDSRSVVVALGTSVLAYDIDEVAKPRKLFEAPTAVSFDSLDGFNNTLSNVFRPPNGDEILLIANGPAGSTLYRQPLTGGEPIAVLTNKGDMSRFGGLAGAEWSPDGTRIVLTVRYPDNPDLGRAWIVNADGTGLRRVSKLEVPPGYVIDEEHTSWSPDGTMIAFGRWINSPDGGVNVRPVIVVDLATGDEQEMSNVEVNGYGGWTWSPDGSSILQVPGEGSEHIGQVLVLDAKTGEMSTIGWSADPLNGPNWQRTKPAS